MITNEEIISSLEEEIESFSSSKLQESGIVVKVFDGMAEVVGLGNIAYGETVKFESGHLGVVFKVEPKTAFVSLYDKNVQIPQGSVVTRENTPVTIGVGEGFLGRVVDSLGNPIDYLGEIEFTERRSIEKEVPPIKDRGSVDEPLETGIMVIDSIVPIGKGQRELIIGGKATGKTSLIADIISHQKDKNVICVYATIGNKSSGTAKLVDILRKKGALDYTVVIASDSSTSSLSQFITPYAACTMAEYFLEKGHDVIVAYDDLSNHAVAYRELSLLLRRFPGREAFPGDIFYIHSKLLERSCKLSKEKGGGSLTALPVAKIQGDNVSSFIPTNLISITDGQIVLREELFNFGIKPAVDTGLSVSRVGGAAQTKAMKQVVKKLKLDLSRYFDLKSFTKFGAGLGEESNNLIMHGDKILEIFKQTPFNTISMTDQILKLFLINNHLINTVAPKDTQTYCNTFIAYFKANYTKWYEKIDQEKALSKETLSNMLAAHQECLRTFTHEMEKKNQEEKLKSAKNKSDQNDQDCQDEDYQNDDQNNNEENSES